MRIGEIVETASTGFIAESFDLNRPPALGSLVVVRVPPESDPGDSTDLYAVVTHGRTAGIDPSRRAVRRSTEVVFDAAIYRENPELAHILRTEFGAALVGYVRQGRVWQHLPPQPPPLHYSVESLDSADVSRFTFSLRYLRAVRDLQGEVPALQVLAAHLRQVYVERGQDREWLGAAAREVAALLKDQYDSVLTVLYAIDPEVAS